MTRRKRNNSKAEAWNRLDDNVREAIPHVSGWWDSDEEFSELRLKARDDGTVLAIAKGYGSDGGPVVCFGSGYGVTGALLALDGTINGGRWRKDRPWVPPAGFKGG